MTLCKRCALLNVYDLDEQDVLFHPDLGSLKSGAERGCEFCSLTWYGFQKSTPRNQLDSLLRGESAWPDADKWTPSIWLLGGHLHTNGTAGAYVEVTCGKGYRDASSQFDPLVNPRPTVSQRLEVYELPGCRSKYRLCGRRSTEDQDPNLYLDLTKAWLTNCKNNHEECTMPKDHAMPTRLIDIGDPAKGKAARLVSSQGIQEDYMALSYCWGAVGSDILTLNAATHTSMAQGIKDEDLAKTHVEFIFLARQLGIQYVWIDALCIIQRDAVDWERESKTMADVYGNAILTVVAGRCADARNGFIANRLGPEGRPKPCKLPENGSSNSPTLVLDLPRSTDTGPVSSRAWCFQERHNSRRTVTFGQEQLRLTCLKSEFLENGITFPRNQKFAFLRPNVSAAIPQDRVLREWYELLNQFTLCNLSNPHDIFAAIASVAGPASRTLKSRYLAGLWECDIVRGLLWRPCYHFQVGGDRNRHTTRPKPTKLTKERDMIVRAPSWSWAAVEGPVSQESFNPSRIALYKDAKTRRVRSQHMNPDNWSLDTQCGVGTLHMPACELQLLGKVFEARVLQESPVEYFDLEIKPLRTIIPRERLQRYGVLLAVMEDLGPHQDDGSKWSHVFGVAFFDVLEERSGNERVWCLLVVRDRGLILKQHKDGRFSRLGWFIPPQEEKIPSSEEIEIRLF